MYMYIYMYLYIHGQIIVIHQADISINPISCATFNSWTISEAFRPAFMPPLPLPCGLVEKITPGKPLFHWENHMDHMVLEIFLPTHWPSEKFRKITHLSIQGHNSANYFFSFLVIYAGGESCDMRLKKSCSCLVCLKALWYTGYTHVGVFTDFQVETNIFSAMCHGWLPWNCSHTVSFTIWFRPLTVQTTCKQRLEVELAGKSAHQHPQHHLTSVWLQAIPQKWMVQS